MQYQVYKKDTNEVVAWIDTETDEQVVHKDYDIKVGDSMKKRRIKQEYSYMRQIWWIISYQIKSLFRR